MEAKLVKIVLTLIASTLLVASGGESNPVRVSDNSDWIYYRHQELYSYLIRFSDIPAAERSLFRRKAYSFLFEYWVTHRSKYASHRPIEGFEKRFRLLILHHVVETLDKSDPLSIRAFYQHGKFTRKLDQQTAGLHIPEGALLPHVEGLPPDRLKEWADYQADVRNFLEFLNCSGS